MSAAEDGTPALPKNLDIVSKEGGGNHDGENQSLSPPAHHGNLKSMDYFGATAKSMTTRPITAPKTTSNKLNKFKIRKPF